MQEQIDKPGVEEERLLSYLDFLNQGVGIFDAELYLVIANRAFIDLMGYPASLCRPGTPLLDFIRYDCRRGLYGDTPAEIVLQDFRTELHAVPVTSFELRLPNGRILEFTRRRADDGAAVCVFTNVTSARRAAELFERDSAVIRQLPDAVALTDLDRRIISANPAFSRYFETEPHEARLRNLPPDGFLAAEETDLFFERMDEAITEYGRHDFELDLTLPSGRQAIFQGSILPRRDGSANMAGYIALYRDVTARARDQRRLQRQDLVIGQLTDSVIVTDHHGYVIDANPATIRTFGYRLEELVGKTVAEALYSDQTPPGYATTQEVLEILLQGRLWSGEMFLRAKDGRLIHCDCVVQPFYNEKGEPIGIIGVHRDVTQRSEAEEALRRQALVIEHMWEAVIVTDTEGVIEEHNASASRIFGNGSQLSLSPALGEQLRKIAAAVLEHDRYEDMYAITEDRAGGAPLYCDCVAVAVRNRNGRIERIISVHRNVTDRILQEQEQRRLEERMRQSKRLETLGQIAGGIAHDFNNILTPILGYAHLARDGVNRSSQPYADISKVIEAMGKAREMVKQILTFGQRVEPTLEMVTFDQTISDSIDLLLAPSLPAEIDLVREFGCGDIRLAGNATLIQQLVINLCNNAVHAMEHKGRLLVRTDQGGDWENVKREHKLDGEGHVRLIVQDTGCGIDETNLERIFDPFFTTRNRSRGTGLGLSVVHGVVRAHGGAILVSSTPGAGTRFEIYFPLRAAVAGKSEPKAVSYARGHGESILVVDDTEEVRDLVCRMLEGNGYRASAAKDGRQALDYLENAAESPDLIITDLSMPNLDGEGLLKALRDQHVATPVIVMSAMLDARTVCEYRAWGASALLHKPISPPDLFRTVTEAFERAAKAHTA